MKLFSGCSSGTNGVAGQVSAKNADRIVRRAFEGVAPASVEMTGGKVLVFLNPYVSPRVRRSNAASLRRDSSVIQEFREGSLATF